MIGTGGVGDQGNIAGRDTAPLNWYTPLPEAEPNILIDKHIRSERGASLTRQQFPARLAHRFPQLPLRLA
jgi:hypothetical protein